MREHDVTRRQAREALAQLQADRVDPKVNAIVTLGPEMMAAVSGAIR